MFIIVCDLVRIYVYLCRIVYLIMTAFEYLLHSLPLVGSLALAACDGVFDFHPYDVRFDGDADINRKAIERIEADSVGCDIRRCKP